MIVTYSINIGFVEDAYQGELELPDDTDREDVDELLREHILSQISWSFDIEDD